MGRNTVQQTIIENTLHQLANHPTAEEVFAAVSCEHPSIGKATVYRTLNKLVETGKALKVPMANGADRFDHTTIPHFHVQCTQCGCVEDVMISAPKGLQSKAEVATGFQIDSVSLCFEGICPDCLAKAAKSA